MGKNNTNTQTPAVTPDPNAGAPAVTPDPNAGAPAVTPDQNVGSSQTAAPTSAPTANSAKQKVKMKKIKLPLSKEQQDDVFVSVNDKKYQIKRGVEVEVPWFVYEVLANQEKALQTLFENQAKAQQNVL